MQPDRPTEHLVSQALETELREELRRYGLVIWLDREGVWAPFVDELAAQHASGAFPWPVVAHRGSYLELLLAVENQVASVEQRPLLIHLPGQTEETVKTTPALELYEAGKRYRKKLQTLVQEVAAGRVPPDELAAYTKQPGLTLADADAWLSQRLSAGRAGLRGFLEGMEPSWLVDGLVSPTSGLRERVQNDADLQVLAARLHQIAGMDQAWLDFQGDRPTFEGLRDGFAKWLLCVEYAHDLQHLPATPELHRLKSLQKPVVELCKGLTVHLRSRYADFYVELSDALESHLEIERQQIQASDLGRIDTFRFEEAKVLEAAVEGSLRAARKATDAAAWKEPHEFVAARHDANSIWIAREEPRRWAWHLLVAAVDFGRALATAGRPLERATTLEEAVEIYEAKGAPIDRAHRDFEARSAALWHQDLPHLALFFALRQELRAAHRAFADELARDFSRICQERGFLPSDALQQRHLFSQIVHPLVDGKEKVALFLVDALRYEMAVELAEGLGGTGTIVDLKARLAELPTVTEVGMNVLAPVVGSNGRLSAAMSSRGFGGFRTGEFTVRTPDDRSRAIRARIGGQTCPVLALDKVSEGSDQTHLRKQIGHADLVIVHSREIDQAGEAGFGLATFAQTLRQIRAAVHHLQTAGVKRFVITSDHGFLLQEADAPTRPFGKKTDPSRRYVLDPHPRREDGLMSVSLAELGYDGADGQHLLLAEDTRSFDTGGKDTFVHGGNSPQERIIPVLKVLSRTAPGASDARFVIEAKRQPDVLGVRRLELRVLSDQLFLLEDRVRLAFRAVDRPQVQARIRQVGKPAREERGAIDMPAGQTWIEVLFDLEGPVDEEVELELHDVDGRQQVKTLRIEGSFDVKAIPAPEAAPWHEAIEDEASRRALRHLEAHGSLTESELVAMLGNARAARRFDLRLDEWAKHLPFSVKTEGTTGGKRYTRRNEKP